MSMDQASSKVYRIQKRSAAVVYSFLCVKFEFSLISQTRNDEKPVLSIVGNEILHLSPFVIGQRGQIVRACGHIFPEHD